SGWARACIRVWHRRVGRRTACPGRASLAWQAEACPTNAPQWQTDRLPHQGLIRAEVFGRDVVLGNFSGVNFRHVRVGRIFDAGDGFGLEGLALLQQFLDALGACPCYVRESLRVAGLAGRTGTASLPGGRRYSVRSESFIVWFLHGIWWCTRLANAGFTSHRTSGARPPWRQGRSGRRGFPYRR